MASNKHLVFPGDFKLNLAVLRTADSIWLFQMERSVANANELDLQDCLLSKRRRLYLRLAAE